MLMLDRWIARRFLGNFILIFAVMFLFAVSIDTILQLDSYIEGARLAVKAGRFSTLLTAVPAAIVDFNLPRLFQFFAYMVGLCSVAAAGFTFTQMVRAREVVASRGFVAAPMSKALKGLGEVRLWRNVRELPKKDVE